MPLLRLVFCLAHSLAQLQGKHAIGTGSYRRRVNNRDLGIRMMVGLVAFLYSVTLMHLHHHHLFPPPPHVEVSMAPSALPYPALHTPLHRIRKLKMVVFAFV